VVREVSLTRLRWRLKGAWMWPTFFAVTAVDAVVLHLLPFAGSEGLDLFGAVILAGFFNLFVVAVVAPLTGWLVLRRRNPGLPRDVARDYAGTALIVAVAALMLAGGLVHRPTILEEERDRAAAVAAAHDYVLTQAPRRYRANIGFVDVYATDEEDLYRACVPGDGPNRAVCLYVDTSQKPAGVTRDPSDADNATLFGPSPR
jgi:hypothetical protein